MNLSADSKTGSGAGDRHGQHADAVHPITSESLPARAMIVMWASEWHQNQTVYALIEEGSLLDPGGAGLGHRDSSVVMEGRVTVSGGIVTFSVGEESTMTTIVISLTVSVALAEEDTSLVFPDDSEIGLGLTTVFLGNGTWIFIFSVVRLEVKTFHLGSNPDALPLSSTGHVAWARAADINVCDRHLKESLEDFLITHFGSLNGVHNNDALCLTEGVVASSDRSKIIRIVARGLWVAVPFGQRGKAHVLVPRSSWSGCPLTNLVYGSKGAIVVDGGVLRELGRTWNWFEVSTLPTNKCELKHQNSALHNANVDTDSKRIQRCLVGARGTPLPFWFRCVACVEDQENSEKTEVEACRKALDLGRHTWANSVPSGDRRKIATRRTKEEHHHGSPELVQRIGQRCQRTRGSKDGVDKVGCLSGRCSSGMEETSNIQER